MPTLYVDETGFTGEDLLSDDQPIFVQATHDLNADEAANITNDIFGGLNSVELKHSRLARRPANQKKIAQLVKLAARDKTRFAVWVAHKEYAMATMIVEWWIEPLAYRAGMNLYENGANHAMANMLYVCLGGFWSEKFRKKVLLSYQKMFRARTKERFDECAKLVTDTYNLVETDRDRVEVFRYLQPSFPLLGTQHVMRLPERVLDLALPGLVRLMLTWRERHEGPWEVVHDRSSNMAKQKWLWDKLSSASLEEATFQMGDRGVGTFPLNVTTTRFADSISEKQIQLCDVIAGATSAWLNRPELDEYRRMLSDAGIEELIIDSIWPSTDVTPEELGKEGWDGNIMIEWLAEQTAKIDAASRN